MKRLFSVVLTFIAIGTGSKAHAPKDEPANETMIAFSKAGIGGNVIKSAIKTSFSKFDPTANGRIK